MRSERDQLAWWRAHAERGDGVAMIEVAERLERGRGAEKNPVEALAWYTKAVRAGVPAAPALVGETVFEQNPVAGLVWLLLGLERAPEGDDSNVAFASSLSLLEPRLTDRAIEAAQVWADLCREREGWPDDVAAPHGVEAPFRPRPPTPELPTREPRHVEHLTQAVRFGPWTARVPPAAHTETVLKNLHLKVTWGGAFAQHLVWATLAPGLDIDAYVRRSLSSTGQLWRKTVGPERFLINGLDTTAIEFTGQGPTVGQRALKRFVTSGDHVAVLTAVAPSEPFGLKRSLLEAIADSVTHGG